MTEKQSTLSVFDEQEFITPPELAAIIRTDPATVRDWCKRKVLLAIDTRAVGAKRPRWKISRQAWDDFTRMRTGTPPARRQKRKADAASDLSEYFGDEFTEIAN